MFGDDSGASGPAGPVARVAALTGYSFWAFYQLLLFWTLLMAAFMHVSMWIIAKCVFQGILRHLVSPFIGCSQ